MRPEEHDSLMKTGRAAYSAIVEMVNALQCDYDQLEELKDEQAALVDALEDARTRIHEDALSVQVRSGWVSPGEEFEAEEFELLLATGGPAVRIRGELNQYKEPDRAWLEVQDWGTPWTQYFDAEQDVLLQYARCFWYGD